MEEAVKKTLQLFYNGSVPTLLDIQVLYWSPETEFITLRWKEGDRCITVKRFDYGVENQITQLR